MRPLNLSGLEELLEGLVDQVAGQVAERVREELEARGPVVEAEPWRLLGVDEVAERLGRSRRWVHQAIRERGLPYVRLDGGALGFELEQVRDWARARQVPASKPVALAPRLQDARQPASVLGSGEADR